MHRPLVVMNALYPLAQLLFARGEVRERITASLHGGGGVRGRWGERRGCYKSTATHLSRCLFERGEGGGGGWLAVQHQP